MRISDWSSDVCSSDLECQGAGDRCSGDGQEYRIELHHGHTGGRERPAEDHHANQTIDPSRRSPVHATLLQLQDSYRLRWLAWTVTVRYNSAELLRELIQYR